MEKNFEQCVHGFDITPTNPCSAEVHEKALFRRDLAAKVGDTWSGEELQRDFEVKGFGFGLCVVRRKSDNQLGSLEFTHMPRFYYGFMKHEVEK